MLTRISFIAEIEIFGNWILRKSKGETPWRSVRCAITSQTCHSGMRLVFWYQQYIVEMSLKILRIPLSAPSIFGIFGGGGRFGRTIFGRDGKSGRSGRFGIAGRIGRDGSVILSQKFGRERSGRSGSLIGARLNWNSGTDILMPSCISERSRMIFGQRGNLITGIDGIIMERSLYFQYCKLYRSL